MLQRTLTILTIIFVIFEDLIRKYIPGNTALIFLIKDLFIILLYCHFLVGYIDNKKSLIYSPIVLPVLSLFLYELFSFIWTDEFYLLVFFNGLKLDFFYFPLVFIVPYLFSDDKLLIKFNFIAKITLILLFFLQLFEIVFPNRAESLMLYSISDDYDKVFHLGHSFEGGTFIKYYKTFYFSEGKFCDMILHLYLIYIISILFLKKFKPSFVILMTFLTFFMLFMSGKRIFILLFPMLLFALSISFYKYKVELLKMSKSLFRVIKRLNTSLIFFIVGGLSLLIFLFFSNETVSISIQFIYSALSEGIVTRFFEENNLYNYEFYQLIKSDYLWYGQGVGTNSQGVNAFFPNAEYVFNLYEMGYFKFINEHGLFGLLIFITFIFSSLKLDLKTIKMNKDITIKIISILILTYHIIIFLRFFNGHQFFGSSQTIFWFWMIMGIQLHLLRKSQCREKEIITY